jgi:alpha-1,2-mannosyltransferase
MRGTTTLDARPQPTDLGPRWIPRRPSEWLVLLGIVVVAFIARSVPVLRGGGLDGDLGYDDGVYFASAVGLVHGVLPYRDFLMLHPPGILIILSPFALLATATDDSTGFAVARIAFMMLGAINAGLVALVAGQYGRRAALFAGVLYAIWYSATRVERTTLLLGPETTLLLIGVLILGWRRPLGARRAALGGAVLGFSVAIQLWQAVPLLIVAGAVALASRNAPGDWRRPVLALLAGALAASAAVCLSFFLAAPGEFLRYVLLDQLARPNLGLAIVTRLRDLEGLPAGGVRFGSVIDALVLGLAALGAAAVAGLAWRVPAARMWCALVTVETTYLLLGPVFITHYSGWIAPPAAIVLGTAAAVVVGALDRYRRFGTIARAGYFVLVAVFAFATIPKHQGLVIQRAALEGDIRGARCVSSDSPVLLLETTGLRRDVRAGCQLVLDPTGVSYDTDRGRLKPGPVSGSRLDAPGYQQAMVAYYAGSDAALFTRHANGLTASTQAAIARKLPVVVVRGSVTVMLPAAKAGR